MTGKEGMIYGGYIVARLICTATWHGVPTEHRIIVVNNLYIVQAINGVWLFRLLLITMVSDGMSETVLS